MRLEYRRCGDWIASVAVEGAAIVRVPCIECELCRRRGAADPQAVRPKLAGQLRVGDILEGVWFTSINGERYLSDLWAGFIIATVRQFKQGSELVEIRTNQGGVWHLEFFDPVQASR